MTNFILPYSPKCPSKPLKSFNEIGGRLPHTYAVNKRYGPVPKCYHDLPFSKGTPPLSDTDLDAPPASLYMKILKGAFKDILIAAEQGKNKKPPPVSGNTNTINAGEVTLVEERPQGIFTPGSTSTPSGLKRPLLAGPCDNAVSDDDSVIVIPDSEEERVKSKGKGKDIKRMRTGERKVGHRF